jgi:hypothetical protein
MSIYQIQTTSSNFSGLMEYQNLDAAQAAFETAWTLEGSVTLFVDGKPVETAEFDKEGAPIDPTVEIRPVDGISLEEIEDALSAETLWLGRATRWNTLGGGFAESRFQVRTSPPEGWNPKPNDFYANGPGPIESPLTRAMFFNADRKAGYNSAFTTDRRVQRIVEAMRSIPGPELNRPAVWVEFKL